MTEKTTPLDAKWSGLPLVLIRNILYLCYEKYMVYIRHTLRTH